MSGRGGRVSRRLRVWRVLGALAIAVVLCAHYGTDHVFYAGDAGPWNVRVSIRQPGVIPGLADISVRVAEPGVDSVRVTTRQTREGTRAEAPPPDIAKPVRGESGLHAAQLWLMVRGPTEVVVTVFGAAGAGEARIPMVARASRQLAMSPGLGLFVLGGGLFLVVGLLTAVGAATRESVLPAGQEPDAVDRRRARRVTAGAAVVLALVLFGGGRWIRAESAAHRARLDRPWAVEAGVRGDGTGRVLDLEITEPFWVNRDDPAWLNRSGRYRRADLVADHGKLMHMFVIRDGRQDAFAHIHPERVDNSRFTVAFPPLPAGTYRVYADLTHEDGFSHTLVATVEAPESGARDPSTVPQPERIRPDPDDAWWTASASARTDAASVVLRDGSVMRWLNASDPLIAGEDADLAFRVEDADGMPVRLDPYMGMQGHAMLNRKDGEIFMHLHPSGSISMAARAAIEARARGMPAGMDMPSPRDPDDGMIRFPLVVPDAGMYRIWVQVRRGDDVLTASFDAEVVAGAD